MDFGRQQRPDAGSSFLPSDYLAAKAEHRANFLIVLLYSIIMFLIVSAFLITNRRWQTVRARETAVSAEYKREGEKIEQLKVLEERRAELFEKAEITNSLIERVPRSVLLAQINSTRPAGITLLEVELEGKRLKDVGTEEAGRSGRGGQVRSLSGKASVSKRNQRKTDERPKIAPPRFEFSLRIMGVSSGNSPITDYLAALTTCPLLEGVDLEYIEQTMLDSQSLRKFQIRARLRQDADVSQLDLALVDPIDLDAPLPGGEGGPEDRAAPRGGWADAIFNLMGGED
ncbi:MAG: hypothetical protein H6811_07550 [Phycisphaeraceae bacterium]|nr:hypothetical protein [Phycisphaeraceae bacterium]